MIGMEGFDTHPMIAGETREVVLSGDGPFQISDHCFVDKPKPPGPGFIPCSECVNRTVAAGVSFSISCSSKFWEGKEGSKIIEITDRLGEHLRVELGVLPYSDSTPHGLIARNG